MAVYLQIRKNKKERLRLITFETSKIKIQV